MPSDCKLPAVIAALAEKAAERTWGCSPTSVCSMIYVIWKARTGLSGSQVKNTNQVFLHRHPPELLLGPPRCRINLCLYNPEGPAITGTQKCIYVQNSIVFMLLKLSNRGAPGSNKSITFQAGVPLRFTHETFLSIWVLLPEISN